MQSKRASFTLLEVLISIGLLGLILPALFAAVDGLRKSNNHLKEYLFDAQAVTKAVEVLYHDIASSDGNLTIKKDEYTRLCLQNTSNSLYGLSEAKVCWLVLKKKNVLTRVEGWDYRLPTRSEEMIEADRVVENIEIFDVYHKSDKVLIVLKEKKRKALSFLVQGVTKPKPPKKKKRNPQGTPQTPQQPNPNGANPQRVPPQGQDNEIVEEE
jgi:type II secretory pathway component PulJ